jgi:very-short-patch-repair endonuclease/predicted transcriptional regulator of viral defense system
MMACYIRRDSEVWKLAGSQHGLVTGAQLRELGFTRSAIAHRVRTGRLWRVHPGVFAVGRPELTREGLWLAAVLACGEGAVLSHLCAAALLEMREGAIPRWPQVSVPTDSGRLGPRGIDLHRAATLRANDIIERNAIPVTSLPRTLIDLASVLGDKELKSALRQAERRHRIDLQHLRISLDAFPRNSHRHARLRRALDAYVPGTAGTEGEPEAAFLALCAHRGLPLPQTQVPIGRYRADFLWPDLALVVEIDDRASHDGYVAFHDDRVRDRTMKAAGLDVLRFTRNEVLRETRNVAREVTTAIASRTIGGSRTP